MKLTGLFLATLFAGSALLRADVPIADSAYANAFLELSSSNQAELGTAYSSTPTGYAGAVGQPGLAQNTILVIGSGGTIDAVKNESVSGFSDKFTIDNPALTGSSGTLSFDFTVNGTESFAVTPPGSEMITATADFTGPGPTSDDLTVTRTNGVVTSGSDFLGKPQMVTVPFVFGTPFTMTLDINITALVAGLSSGGSAMVSGSFSTVATISDVTAAIQQEPLSALDYSVDTASGASYISGDPALQSIPEPSSLFFAMAGLAVFPILRKRRFWR